MSGNLTENTTLQYYTDHAEDFVNGTVNADVSALYEVFEKYVIPGGKLLDLGCGSGRDTLHFLRAGFSVESVDGSPEICRTAERLVGKRVRCLLFEDLDYTDEFDGIWACASLLHVPSADMSDVFRKVILALKNNGFLYVSYKYGTGQHYRNGRIFSDFTEDSFKELLVEFPELKLMEMWITEDVRPRRTEKWLNVILQKIE